MDDILGLLYCTSTLSLLIVYHKVYLFFGISVASAPPTTAVQGSKYIINCTI